MPAPVNNKEYVLGRGKVFFDEYVDGALTETGQQRYVGNTPEFGFTMEVEDLDHTSSDEGVGEIDDSVQLSVNRTGNLVMDSLSLENIKYTMFGAQSTVVATSATAVTETLTAVAKNRYYQLGRSAGDPFGVRNISNVALTGTPTPVLNTDYTVDLASGRIFIPETSAATGNIGVTYDRAAVTRDRVLSGSTPRTVAIFFQATNPKGAKVNYYMPKVTVTPSGDFNLKSESDWATMTFTLKILKPDGREAIYADGVPYTP